MTDREEDRICREYLAALADGNFDALERLWELAGLNPALEEAFHELNAELDREGQAEKAQHDAAAIETAVVKHLPTAEIEKDRHGPVTLSAVAEELFRHTPDQLPAAAHILNDKLRQAAEPMPADLNLPKFIAWIEALYGPAPRAYWKAFYDAAIKLDLKRTEAEYQLAARSAPKPEEPR